MKYFNKITLFIFGAFILGGIIYLQKNPGFKLLKLDTSNFEVGINQGHAFIKRSDGKIAPIPISKGEKDLEAIWSTNHQEIYLLRRNNKGINQIFSVHPITYQVNQQTTTIRPKSNLQAVSKQRVCFQSGNEVLLFCFRTQKTEGLLPPLFVDQAPESRAKIFAFYHQLEGQLINYTIDRKLKEIYFKWKDPFNKITVYNQSLIASENVLSLPN